MTGRFLSFEGIDGSGKSTQARLLAENLRALGLPVTLTREPGGSPGAEEIRRLVLQGDPDRWSPQTEALLFTAARRDHLEKTIQPALARGDIVITDRFADSTRMYQGLRGLIGNAGRLTGASTAFATGTAASDPAIQSALDTVNRLHDLMIGVDPDLTFLIDLDPALGLSRAVARSGPEQRFEEMGLALQTALRAGFLSLAAQHPRFAVIDGAATPEAVAAQVLAHARARLGV